MDTIVWLILGFFGSLVLIKFSQSQSKKSQNKIFGIALIVAAIIYVIFAILYANVTWVLIEAVGVAVYGLFYLLSKKYGVYVLALGWILHPIWDINLHLLGAGAEFVPKWYAVACLSFDVTVAIYLVYQAKFKRVA
ncbi:DUF6010 family protein [Aliivibrio wodanis]|uniref:DUF6010 family protein n=1 Tax=Aliivibrio wodanis TaxID=80852 RepID=UPI00406C3C6B